MNNPVSSLIYVIVAVVVVYCLRLLLPFLGLPAVLTHVILIVIGLICVVAILRALGWVKWP